VTAANMPVFGPLHGGGLVRCKLLATAASLLFGLGAIPASALAQDAAPADYRGGQTPAQLEATSGAASRVLK
jgi:hypothetical protein